MAEHECSMEVGVTLRCTERGEAAIDRYVDLTPEQGEELASTPGMSRDDVERVLIGALLRCGIDDAHRLDGWADLSPGDIEMRIQHVDWL